jgi:hypothetical protein
MSLQSPAANKMTAACQSWRCWPSTGKAEGYRVLQLSWALTMGAARCGDGLKRNKRLDMPTLQGIEGVMHLKTVERGSLSDFKGSDKGAHQVFSVCACSCTLCAGAGGALQSAIHLASQRRQPVQRMQHSRLCS